jgi:triacylglycerol lipase
MSNVIAAPEIMAAAASDLSGIESGLSAAHSAAATQTTEVVAAAGDEVSGAIAALFSAHGKEFQALGAQAAAFQAQFRQALTASAGSYSIAEAANLPALGDTILSSIFAASPVTPVPAGKNPTFTGAPSLLGRLESELVLRPINYLLNASGFWTQLGTLNSPVQNLFSSGLLSPIFSDTPPKLLTWALGETVTRTDYQGMPVVQIAPAHPNGNYVVAIHGGAFVWPPLITHWIAYSVMAYQTGATIEVPIYPLVQQGGTAGVVVPKVAGLIESTITAHGASHVSVLGDSAGGNIALAAVEYLVAHNETVPASMVLLSPAPDLTWNNPALSLVNSPFAGGPANLAAGQQIAKAWAGGLSVTDPLVSPLYGSLQGLPPTYVYAGSWDPIAPYVLSMQQQAVTQGVQTLSFSLVNGQFHDWLFLSPDGLRYFPQIYQELGA